MGAPVLNGPFVMPMFRSFVPRKMQPWIYLFIAVTFQLSGGVYLGALNHMIGGMAVMREDILMCMYANLAGMAIYFPVVPYEVPFYQQDTAYVRCTGSATLQPDSAAHHFPSAVVADMLHRRNVQDSGNFRMYVQHSVMDDAQA